LEHHSYFHRKGQLLLFGPVFLPPSAHESRRLLALPFIPLCRVPFGPSIIVPSSTCLLLRLSALECLSSLADCMTYFALLGTDEKTAQLLAVR
jgi:hypothetical protein